MLKIAKKSISKLLKIAQNCVKRAYHVTLSREGRKGQSTFFPALVLSLDNNQTLVQTIQQYKYFVGIFICYFEFANFKCF